MNSSKIAKYPMLLSGFQNSCEMSKNGNFPAKLSANPAEKTIGQGDPEIWLSATWTFFEKLRDPVWSSYLQVFYSWNTFRHKSEFVKKWSGQKERVFMFYYFLVEHLSLNI